MNNQATTPVANTAIGKTKSCVRCFVSKPVTSIYFGVTKSKSGVKSFYDICKECHKEIKPSKNATLKRKRLVADSKYILRRHNERLEREETLKSQIEIAKKKLAKQQELMDGSTVEDSLDTSE